ncbi:MAG TPA: thiamine pyrophosphate-dependent enzyme, partial [Blastocatellia bacterium]
NQSSRSRATIASADLILGFELIDFWGTVNTLRDQLYKSSRAITNAGVKTISIGAGDLFIKSNFQNFQRFLEVDIAIAADAEATLPSLIEAVKRLITPDRKRAFEARGAKLTAASRASLDKMRTDAAYAWDASPISTARLSAELWAQIKGDDWSLVSNASTVSQWPLRLWSFDKHYQFIGGSGGAGVGYGAPAAIGAALANRKHGRLSINIQNDGDLMYAPGVLWTAAHHKIPLLNVMHNNRAYHQELMHLQRMANRHNRGIDRAKIGAAIEGPNIDYAKLAQSMGLYAEGPISDPKELGPAIKTAIAAVKRGEPALIDVVTQPR